ncbi:MFS transporter [Salinadaptatus halalkaliphilus]|uniref:MFS transporter n=2 Tax=Salinadaptatus halalkaliphilus TaxID=2419781 RepID=A0A4S3TQ37_9EURY|nr:MFS transporter [Salinadaptatus halalkaliphilus]
MGARMVYPVLLPSLREAYDLDLTTAGLLVTVLFLAYAICQLPGGMLADRVGERRTLVASTFLAAGMLVLVITARSAIVLFGATALFGAAIALYAVSRYTVLSSLYSDQLGTANGVTAASADAGQSVLPPLAGILGASVAWQLGFGYLVPVFLGVGIAVLVVVPSADNRPEQESGGDSWSTVLEVVRRPAVVQGTAIYALGLCIWQAFTGFYPTYLIEIKGLSSTLASGLFGLFFVLGIAIKPVAGGAYDRVGARRSLLVVGLVSGAALAALPSVEGFWPLVIVTALISALLGVSTIVEAFLLTIIPDRLQGTGFGVVRTTAFLIGALSPVAFGAAGDRGLFDEAFLALAAVAGIVVLVTLCLADD